MRFHLTHEQISDVLLEDASTLELSASANDAVHEHLSTCLICSGELASLRQAFSSFRDTSIALASRELLRASLHPATPDPAAKRNFFHQPGYWAAGVAAALLLAVLPLGMHHPQPTRATPAVTTQAQQQPARTVQSLESDEALLNDINQQLSASVPTSMQPLEDTSTSASNSPAITQRNN